MQQLHELFDSRTGRLRRMASMAERSKSVARWQFLGIMYFFCCMMMLIYCITMASAERPSAIDAGSEAFDAGLKEKSRMIEHSSATYEGKWNQVEYSNIVSSRSVEVRGGRRQLNNIGPAGSTPPQCTSKCSTCNPCVAVRVSIKPGMVNVVAAYYPQAWRCQCRGSIFMP